MKELIREIENFDKTLIEEKKSTEKNIKFSAPFITANSKNKNNRRYPFEILNTAIEKYSAKVDAGRGYGASLHPASGKVEIGDISHRITKVFMKDKVAYIEGEILPGEKGKKILSIINSGGVLGVSARGFGEQKKAKDGVMEIQKGYFLDGIDFIVNPSENVATINKSNIFESAPIQEERFFSLQKELTAAVKEKAGKKSYVIDFSDKEIIYKVYTDGGEISSEGEDTYYKIGYKISSEKIELVGEPQKVEKSVQYEKQMTEDDLYNLYIMEYLPSGGRRSFSEYCKLTGKNNE